MLRRLCARVVVCCLIGMAFSTDAASLPNVVEIDSIDSTTSGVTALNSTTFVTPPSAIHLASYHCIGGAPCAPDGGEGLLIHPTGATGCNVSNTDSGRSFFDNSGNCWYRQNLNGDLRQWGLTLGSAYDGAANGASAADSSGLVTTAVGVLLADGLHEASTHGVNLIWNSDFSVQSQFVIDCGVAVGFVDTNANYTMTNISGIIAHPPGTKITFPSSANSGGFQNCIFERSGDSYAPAVWYPSGTDGQALRDSLTMVAAFDGDGLTINSDAPTLNNVMILGFDRCFDMSKPSGGSGAKHFVIQNVTGDCGSHASSTPGEHAAFSIKDVSSGGYFENLRTNSFLVKADGSGPTSQWNIDNIVLGSGGTCKIVAHIEQYSPGPPSDGFTFVAGDTIWVSLGTNTSGAQSCIGKWTAGVVSHVDYLSDGCDNTAGCQGIILTGSHYPPATTTGTWTSGSNMVTLPLILPLNTQFGDGTVCIEHHRLHSGAHICRRCYPGVESGFSGEVG